VAVINTQQESSVMTMDDLAFELQNLVRRSGDGSFATRADRQRGLQLIARALRALGYELPGARSLKPKHVEALVASWQKAGLSAGTLKNRMGWLRWWAEKIDKKNVVPRENDELGIPDRHAFKGNRAHVSSPEQLSALPSRVSLAVRLQMAFGLRLEESLKFRVRQADAGDAIDLQASWCKGGRARTVPITHERQRALLEEVRRACGDGALIPPGQTYKAFRKEVESTTWRAGIYNMHGHRHWYAQWRYQILTGHPCPAAGGPTYERMTRVARAIDYTARLQISGELGHNRLEITDTYLGSRFALKQKAAA
jgi:integrase